MPELPEVEAARRAVEEHCLGKRIKRAVVADDPKVVEGVTPADFEAALVGKTILQALRKGKNLWLRLDSPPFPSFQFGMTGAIYIKGVAVTKYKRSAVNTDDEWPSKYSKVFLELDDGLELSFTDKRRFARVRLLQDPGSTPPISELGPDALLEPMELDEFVKSLSSKKAPIKALLLDQRYIAGIGNWVADEVLYHARIHPLQTAASLSREKCEVLCKCIKEVLEKALEVGADSTQFPSNWIFHSREKKPGKAFVAGKKIEFITAGGRTTAFVPELQKLDGDTSGKTSGGKSRKSRSAKLSGNEVASSTKEDDDREDEVSEDEGSRLKSELIGQKSRGTGGTAKKLSTKRSTRANRDGEEESETKGEKEKEEPDVEKKGNTRKPKPKKGKSTAGDTKRPPAKKETRSVPEKGAVQKKKMGRGAAKKHPEVKEKASTKRTKAEQTSTQQAKTRRK